MPAMFRSCRWGAVALFLIAASVSRAQLPVSSRPTSGEERSATAPEATVVIGPMAGAVTQRSARLWAQLRGAAADSETEVWAEYARVAGSDAATPVTLRTERVKVNATTGWTVQILLDRLEPGTPYAYSVHWQGRKGGGVSARATFKTETLWQFRTDPPTMRVLAGSCAYTNDPPDDRPSRPYGRDPAIFETMAGRDPDLTVWMGDNLYFREPDFGDETAMAQRYDKFRSLPELQSLWRKGQHLATWDDHDFGPNDSNSSYVHKDKSLRLFQRYWVNPSYGLPGLPGVFTSQTIGDAEFFMLDDRWYRDSDRLIDDDRAMLGREQIRWLKNALLASTATWKFIVSGSQVLNLSNHYEGWNRFPRESQEFLAWLEKQRVPGVIILSGDRHFSVMLKQERAGTYPLYELTCSPLTAGTYDNPSQETSNNSRIMPGSVVTRNNFCELNFSGARGSRRLKLAIHDGRGEALWSMELAEAELK